MMDGTTKYALITINYKENIFLDKINTLGLPHFLTLVQTSEVIKEHEWELRSIYATQDTGTIQYR